MSGSSAPQPTLTPAELDAALAGTRLAGERVALVPTMGALHRGHGALMTQAREAVGEHGLVVVSVFVNPLQFGAGEDLDRYPRTEEGDLALCADHGVDVVFSPSVQTVYPGGDARVSVDPGPLGEVLEGASRPGHFRGVLTVVAKLIGLVRPELATFGEKDYQQLVLIRRMVEDLFLPVEVLAVPTVREDDGLALSSRNRYLDESRRSTAAAVARALGAGQAAGSHGAEAVLEAGGAVLRDAGIDEVDYLALTSPALTAAPAVGPARLLTAVRVGSTRLIDNRALYLSERG